MKLRIPFVLASRSPRRRCLLEQIGLSFEVDVRDVDEDFPDEVDAVAGCKLVALRKAEDAARHRPHALTLGADTIVVLNESILGKPANEDEACLMLRRLSGQTHTVHTGLALVHPESDRRVTTSEETHVTFGILDDSEIEAYVASGSPLDKAGAYGIQDDRGAFFVERIEGDYYNVVGLPLRRLYVTMRSSFSDLLAPDHLVWRMNPDIGTSESRHPG